MAEDVDAEKLDIKTGSNHCLPVPLAKVKKMGKTPEFELPGSTAYCYRRYAAEP